MAGWGDLGVARGVGAGVSWSWDGGRVRGSSRSVKDVGDGRSGCPLTSFVLAT